MNMFSSFFAVIMLSAGFFLSGKTGFFQLSHIGASIKTALGFSARKDKKEGSGVSSFQALSTALGGSIGTANIAGVAGAIAIGGPGAVFWMWIAAFFGMGVKYAEIVLAIKYREKRDGSWNGGPMLYIEKGLHKRGKLCQSMARSLALEFALFGAASALVGTTLVQSNTIAMSVLDAIHIYYPNVNSVTILAISGLLVALLVGIVIIGGVSRIGRASELIVPFMAVAYILACGIVLFNFRANIGSAFISIIRGAFGAKQVCGGAVGFSFTQAFRTGIARGVYSNEAGIGSAPMAYAQASTSDPVKQGMYGVFEVFADTLVMCTMTALVVLASGISVPYGNLSVSGTQIALNAFSTVMPAKTAGLFLAFSMLLFAFTSILGWSVYGIQCVKYLFGERSIKPFCIVYSAFIFVGALLRVDIVWKAGETLNYLMAIPNLFAVTLLSGEVRRMTQEFTKFELKKRRR